MSIRDIILELDFPRPGKWLQSGPLFKGGRVGDAEPGHYCVCLFAYQQIKKRKKETPPLPFKRGTWFLAGKLGDGVML